MTWCHAPSRPYAHGVNELETSVDALATETNFSGAVRADRDGSVELATAYGLAHRGADIPNTIDTQFAIASGTKGFTALTVVSLIEEGRLELSTTARSVLGPDLPLIDDAVTVEQLLAHRSGVGDYFDEDIHTDVNEYVLPVSVHELADAEQYLRVLDGFPTKFAPDERFSYCNGGYAVLALIVERTSGTSFHELLLQRVCAKAGMSDTAFLRSDEPTARAALGYLTAEGPRTNVFHLPVRGGGDGGIYTTAADIHAFWDALLAGRIVSKGWVAEMVRPRSDVPEDGMRYGLGFWLDPTGDAVSLVGQDAGVSFSTVHDPTTRSTLTVLSNTSAGAWPIAKHLAEVHA
jgi:CubicO group peptidase (beta-lactamase class C family)